ncbi:MAG TPA: FAD-dependent oxidoreductase [Actinomycetota bacterium]|nr:FAD-dependent oxidoreductase [Actinomycetota bacterium]
MSRVVIIGAGMAAATTAVSLRDGGFDGQVTLIGAEPVLPYERPPLSKEFLRGEEAEPRWVRPPDWYRDNAVEVRLGTRAERLMAAERVVELEGGERVPFDQAVVATGVRNRRLPIPGVDLPGVLDLRAVPDAEAIRAAVVGASKAVIVGMGFIGAEVAASLRQRGLDVTVVEFFATPLERVLGPELGRAIEALHRDHGVEMIFRDAAERFEGDGRFEALLTKEGRRIEGDVAVVGVGVEPMVEAAGQDVPIDNGILVDATLRTGVEGVWAIGDVARHDHPVFGSVRVEHFDNAMRMGETVARNLLGADEIHDDPHWFWSDQYDEQVQMSGFATAWDQTVIRGSVEDRSFAAFLLQEGRLLSTFGMNWRYDVRRSMPLISAAAHPDPALLADPDVDLRDLQPSGEART